MSQKGRSLADWLALNRTVGVVLISVLFFGLGEQLWSQFMPVYLESQVKQATEETAPGEALPLKALLTIGLFFFLQNLFEGFCYLFGGRLTAWLGDRGSLILFGCLTIAGYLLFLAVPLPAATVLAALLIMGWEPLSVPVTFTTVGSTVESEGRGMAFALQSIQKRLPRILGPALAGLVLGAAEGAADSPEQGRIWGMQVLIGAALALAVVSLAIQWRWMPHREDADLAGPAPTSLEIVQQFDPQLRRLLVAEIFTRWCDWLVRALVVLYVMHERGESVRTVGFLMAAQNLTALATYVPVGRLTRDLGLQPFIGLTFVFFALFPLALALSPGGPWLYLAFVVYGLREIGEPARKALITSLLPESVRARGVGLYWGLRSFAMCSASLVGAWVWHAWGPDQLLYLAFGIGCLGAGVFYLCFRGPKEQPAETIRLPT